MIQAENLTKYYGQNTTIQNVSFKVNKGETVGFLGPTGAGKTTTMRILTAYTPPSEGAARVNGYDVFEDSFQVRKHVGYLPESVPLYNDMTVDDYLNYIATLRKLNNRAKRVNETLHRVNLQAQSKAVIGNLPKDVKLRIGIGQAIIHNPQVLILDEPTLDLEPQQIIEIRQLIKSLGQEYTIILNSHILSEVAQTCNRIFIINKGHIVAEDTPESLTARLEGCERVRLKVINAPDNAAEILYMLPQVKGVCPHDANTFELECTTDSDYRAALTQLVLENGWKLLELSAVNVNLEDVLPMLTTHCKRVM